MAADTHRDVPYLVVGAGPTGMTLARLLANAGRRCLVVERRDGPQPNPSAHVVNARTLEIFRQAGFDMAAIAGIAKPPADAGHVNFVTRLNGELIGRLPFERQGDECLAHTPTPLRNISQHRLEPLMAAEIRDLPGVELRYGTEWVSSTQDADGVTSVIRDVATGATTVVRSSYLLAADGAGSAVRKSLGIEMVGPQSLQDFVAIHFLANLRPYVADRLGVLHFVMDPAAAGTFIVHDLDRESVFMLTYDSATQTVEDFPAERCTELLRNAIGDPDSEVSVVRAGTWHMTAQVAERMRSGRTFLVGDAAHRFPPTGGMGLNTGVADAHNLVWKLCAVEDGWAAADLLDTYQAERHPIAHTNCHQSMTNAFQMVVLADALGLHPGATSADLAATIADPANRDRIAAGVQAQATHFDMLGLQLGYVYADGALADRFWCEYPASYQYPLRVNASDLEAGKQFPKADLAGLAPIVPPRWGEINSMTIAFGHGLAVAPLQAVEAVGALVNGGRLITPTFLKRTEAEALADAPRVIRPETSEALRYVMRLNAVSGSARKAAVPGFFVGGKTGTAEKVVNGHYAKNRLFTTFMAVAPADKPRYLFLTIMDEPKGLPETFGNAQAAWNSGVITGKVIEAVGPILIEPHFEPPANPFPTMAKLHAWGVDRQSSNN